jgi:hypothetical protein
MEYPSLRLKIFGIKKIDCRTRRCLISELPSESSTTSRPEDKVLTIPLSTSKGRVLRKPLSPVFSPSLSTLAILLLLQEHETENAKKEH